MKSISLLIYFSFFIFHSVLGQGGTWTWISGDSAFSAPGVYGTKGVPSVSNHPPVIYESCDWKDKAGNFWMLDNNGDLWKYNPVTNEWTWVKGSGTLNQLPVYGTKGVPNASNTPGGRILGTATWVDTTGDLWLFGGFNNNVRSDLWKYTMSTNNWTWMSGSNTTGGKATHGIKGLPYPLNAPGGRTECASAWTDSLNNLWLFGGLGYDENAAYGNLNDLFKYDIGANEWTWINGSTLVNAPTVYGVKGVTNASNDPGGRYSYTKWKDASGNFWIMGAGYALSSPLNDLWKYDINVNEWTWMSGTKVIGDSGSYRNTCAFDSLEIPAARVEHRAATTDNCNRFWLFGGYGTANNMNDLWVFDPQQMKWQWLTGSTAKTNGNYGTFGVPSASNSPPARVGAMAWWGNNNKFYIFSGDGMADLWVFSPDTNCISFTSCASAAVVAPPVAAFQSNKTSICENDCINFTDLSTGNATSWQWHFAGAIDSTSTVQNPQSVCYSTAGVYSVMLVASNSGGSDTLTIINYITINPAPPTPTIQDHPGIAKDTLICSSNSAYISYQWYKDSILISGATDSILIAYQNDNYNVEITGGNGCKISAGINVILGLRNYMSDHILSIFPNPAADRLIVKGYLVSGSAELIIYNTLGQVCRQSGITNPIRQLTDEIQVNVSSLPPGVYFVQVMDGKSRLVGRFIKE